MGWGDGSVSELAVHEYEDLSSHVEEKEIIKKSNGKAQYYFYSVVCTRDVSYLVVREFLPHIHFTRSLRASVVLTS